MEEYFTGELDRDIREIKTLFGESFDFITREIDISGTRAFIICVDGMFDELKSTEAVIKPLTQRRAGIFLGDIYDDIRERLYKGTDTGEVRSPREAAISAINGNLLLIAEGHRSALTFSLQGYPKRSVSEPQSEQNEKGSQEGFTDNFKDNVALLRRRLKSPELITEKTEMGNISRTPVILCYVKGRADGAMLAQVRERLKNAELDSVLGTGYIRPFLDTDRASLFSGTGLTERPDTLAAMLTEGRVGIIVDGTPYAVIVPYLFSDELHTADDYLSRPYYALFMRLLRTICFVIAVMLPGVFVAVCLFHPEMIPADIMYDIASAESRTPFPLTVEALVIHLIYEIVREAGLRMPVAIGHAVSIVGALVIGDTAVTAGLIAAPMLIVVALTAVSSSAVSKLHESIAVMRFAFIIVGGLTGLYGIMVGTALMITDMCSVSPFGVPYSAPFSPFVKKAQRDTILRAGWKKLGRRQTTVGEMQF